MTRRTIGLLVTLPLAILVAPLAAEGQPRDPVPRIGILTQASEASPPLWEAFRQGLRALGYVEGKHLILEYRFTAGKPERFSELAAELVRFKVDLLVTDATSAARAAKDATNTIPIVMAVSGAPIEAGLVASLHEDGLRIHQSARADGDDYVCGAQPDGFSDLVDLLVAPLGCVILDASQHNEDNQHQQDESYAPAGVIAPPSTIGPQRQRAQ